MVNKAKLILKQLKDQHLNFLYLIFVVLIVLKFVSVRNIIGNIIHHIA